MEQQHAVLHRRHRRRRDRADGHAAHQRPRRRHPHRRQPRRDRVPFTTMTVKGQEYAVFPAVGGAHQATYGGGGGANLVSAAKVTTSDTGDTAATWTTEEPGTSVVRLGTSPGNLSTRVSLADRTTDHLAELEGLAPATRYYYRLESRGPGGALTTWPAAHAAPASFTTTGADRRAPRISDLRVVPMPDGTARVTWRTDEPATSLVRYGRAGRSQRGAGARRPAGPAPRRRGDAAGRDAFLHGARRIARRRRERRPTGVPRGSGRRHGAWPCSPSRTSAPAPPTAS